MTFSSDSGEKTPPLKQIFFIKAGQCDRGAAWHEEAEETYKPYLRVVLDDPSFCKTGMARRAGVEIAETHLFPGAKSAGYFATKRFDREGSKRLHMHTACGLLHSDFRAPSLDYQDLIELTTLLTRDVREVEKMFRLAVFNVLAHNRDDHSKNFSFLMDDAGEWRLSPAYDLTFSSGPDGEHSTMVMREGKVPSLSHLRALGEVAGVRKNRVEAIIDQTRTALSDWPSHAKELGVRTRNTRLIAERMAVVL